VSPKGVEVKTVFLPEVAVVDKVSRLRDSSKTTGQAFDEKTARELYAYLIKPFANYLNQDQAVIIPQGPLVGLPFEALVDAEDGKFLAEKMAVSYAPNAAFIMRAFKGRLPEISTITAIYDEKIENDTQEISRIKGVEGVHVGSHSSQGMKAEDTIKLLGDAKTVHVLLHGKYNDDDPLQSTVKINEGRNRQGEYLTAAELLAADWRNKHLAVFSSCEGALVKTRISNEQFGISWALLAGGADQVMLSRWRVNASSNAIWMETFYKSLAVEKMSPALAANAAKRKMINSDKRHPYYWAGPQVFGR
jgi:CHAT domain-containing protein